MVRSNTRMPRRFRFVLLAALVLPAIALAACGGSSGGGASASDLLKATFGPNHTVKSGQLSVALGLDAGGLKSLKGPIAIKLTGPFQTTGKGKLPQLDLSLVLSGAGTSFNAGAITTGDKAWIRLQGTNFLVDPATYQQFKQGYEQSAAKSTSGSPTFSSLGIDPLRWLKDPKVTGTDTVGGAKTEHITASVDVGAFLSDISTLLGKAGSLGSTTKLPTALTPAQRSEIERSVKSAAVEVWTGASDKTLRRLRLVVGIDVPADLRAKAAGLTQGSLTFDLTIADLDQPQTIKGPATARPLSDLRALLTGQASGTATTPAPTTTTPSAGGSAAASKYLTCLSKAGTDVTKVQQCASLVGQ
jgi:hypothetical protein